MACVVDVGVIDSESPLAEGVFAVEGIEQVGRSWFEPAVKGGEPVFDCGEGFIVKYGVGVVRAFEEFVKVIHIEAEIRTCGALEEDLQVKGAGVRDVDADIEVADGEVVWYIDDCIGHPAAAVRALGVIR